MKKLFLLVALFIGATQYTQAQLNFGIKAGINYNSDSFNDVKDDVLDGAKGKTGYHAGIWLRAKLPIVGLYIRPELVYTQLNSEVNYTARNTQTDFKFSKIDIPILLGTKILGIGNIYAGPSFQYILASDFGLEDLKEVDSKSFSAGMQLGAGIELGKIGVDLRWERSLGSNERNYMDNLVDVSFDARVSQRILGLSYKF